MKYLLLAVLLLPGCASTRMLMYGAQGKVLLFAAVPCAQSFPTKPAMVSAWVRERDIGKETVICSPTCDCRMVAP